MSRGYVRGSALPAQRCAALALRSHPDRSRGRSAAVPAVTFPEQGGERPGCPSARCCGLTELRPRPGGAFLRGGAAELCGVGGLAVPTLLSSFWNLIPCGRGRELLRC